jgi:Ca-activated chloride channel family protein
MDLPPPAREVCSMPRLVLVITLVVAATLGLRAQEPVFRSVANTVPVYATVTDGDDRLVTTLTREAFEVRDNGRPQPLTLFDNTPQAIRLIVLMDVSGSMERNLPLVRAASRELFARLRPDDAAKVGSFAGTATITPAFSKDPRALDAAMPTVTDSAGTGTALWRAINEAMDAFGDGTERRVVLALSDGWDTQPFKIGGKLAGPLELIDRAQRENVMIYAVGLQSRGGAGAMAGMAGMRPGANLGSMLAANRPNHEFGTVAIATGGAYVEIRPRDDLNAVFARVADELHSQYLLGFTPTTADGKSRKIEVRLTTRGLKARARQTYVAPGADRPR